MFKNDHKILTLLYPVHILFDALQPKKNGEDMREWMKTCFIKSE